MYSVVGNIILGKLKRVLNINGRVVTITAALQQSLEGLLLNFGQHISLRVCIFGTFVLIVILKFTLKVWIKNIGSNILNRGEVTFIIV